MTTITREDIIKPLNRDKSIYDFDWNDVQNYGNSARIELARKIADVIDFIMSNSKEYEEFEERFFELETTLRAASEEKS